MSGWFAASLTFRRAALTVCLCLLTFLFAVEAKTAWYGPVAGPGSAVRAAKAMPANAPKAIKHGHPAPDTGNSFIRPAVSSALIAMWLAGFPHFSSVQTFNRLSPDSTDSFSPSNFFRPPPLN